MERSYRMTSPAVQQKLVELLEQIPYEHLLLTDELVAMIRSRVNYPLNEKPAHHAGRPHQLCHSAQRDRGFAFPTR